MNMKLKITMQFYLNIILKIGYKRFNQIFSTNGAIFVLTIIL